MATALELTREGWASYLVGARQQPDLELTPAQKEERERLLERVRQVAAAFKDRFGARRVILFGSLVRTGQ